MSKLLNFIFFSILFSIGYSTYAQNLNSKVAENWKVIEALFESLTIN